MRHLLESNHEDPDFQLEREVALSNTHGTNFQLIQAQEPQAADAEPLTVNVNQIRAALEEGEMPLVIHHGLTPQSAHIEAMESLVKTIALELGAQKVLFVGQQTAELENAISKTRVPPAIPWSIIPQAVFRRATHFQQDTLPAG